MAKHSIQHPLTDEVADLIAQRFAVLSEPMRIKILDHVREVGEASVREIAEGVRATHANVSRHLNVLHRAGIVGRRKLGTRVLYRIVDQGVLRLCEEVCGSLAEQQRNLRAILDPDPREAAA
ncbi:MAG TPA: metalloregulator ArsR/SmtB family transcription factor [Solirubrobacteraceae bacterium]|nr:metalloregulator ArsR/SmtB family transcription factor [Solirubrobacteraceae bacterium]